MQRTPLVAGNWKMHKTVSEGLHLVEDLLPGLEAVPGVEKLLCPPATALMPLSAILDGRGVALGAQDLHWEPQGAFTGELSAAMLAEFCSHVIVGHSERRALFGDDADQPGEHSERFQLRLPTTIGPRPALLGFVRPLIRTTVRN